MNMLALCRLLTYIKEHCYLSLNLINYPSMTKEAKDTLEFALRKKLIVASDGGWIVTPKCHYYDILSGKVTWPDRPTNTF